MITISSLPNKKNKPTFLVADSNEVYLTGLNKIITDLSAHRKLCSANNSAEITTLMRNLSFDIIVSDIVLLGKNLEVLKAIRSKDSMVKILGLSFENDLRRVTDFIECGGNGFLEKNTDKKEIATAIDEILSGRNYLSNNIQSGLNEKSFGNQQVFEKNTPRRNDLFREMLYLLIHECTSKEIANYLNLAERTVEKYRSDLLRETGAKNMIGLVRFALKNNLDQDKYLCSKYHFLSIDNSTHI